MGESKTPRRISSFFMAIIVITLALSTVALFQGASAYVAEGSGWMEFILIGVSGLALSAYMLFQTTRRRTFQLAIKMQPVTTTLVCQKCGFKNLREFQRGDYIFKDVGECPKCKEKMEIASIYREADEKE